MSLVEGLEVTWHITKLAAMKIWKGTVIIWQAKKTVIIMNAIAMGLLNSGTSNLDNKAVAFIVGAIGGAIGTLVTYRFGPAAGQASQNLIITSLNEILDGVPCEDGDMAAIVISTALSFAMGLVVSKYPIDLSDGLDASSFHIIFGNLSTGFGSIMLTSKWESLYE